MKEGGRERRRMEGVRVSEGGEKEGKKEGKRERVSKAGGEVG